MLSQEQCEDDETGKAVVMATFNAIDREHVKAYIAGIFSKPGEMTEKQRTEFFDALFSFASLGWAAFHAMNKGNEIKERSKPERKRAGKKPKPAK